ncbi:zinc alcohol dehydrogenase [Rhypophila decipiens]
MTTLPSKMKGWTVTSNGEPGKALTLKHDLPVPKPPTTGSDILVKVLYAAINPVDLHFMNVLPSWLPIRYHPTPGFDFSGEIVAVGPSVKDTHPELKIGEKVCGAMATKQVTFGKGALVEYVTVPAEMVSLVPRESPGGLSLAQAAGLAGIAGQTASFMAEQGRVEKGWKVVVIGASGGVGSLLVQILKSKGAVVNAICSEGNKTLVEGLGVDEVIPYDTHAPVEKYLEEKFKDQQLDLIFDCAGNEVIYTNSPKYLKQGGRFLTIVGGRSQGIVPFVLYKMRPVILGGTPRPFELLALMPGGALARKAVEYANEGAIKEAPVDSEYAMEDAVKAYEKLAGKHARGKIVIKVGA